MRSTMTYAKKRVFRLFGFSWFGIAAISAVIDLFNYSDTSRLIFRPLGTLWLTLHERSLTALHEGMYARHLGGMWKNLFHPILSQPSVVVFGCLGLLFLAFAWLIPARRYQFEGQHNEAGHDSRGHRGDSGREVCRCCGR